MGTSATTALAALMELLPSADNPADAGGEQAPVERIERPATDRLSRFKTADPRDVAGE